MTDKTVLDHVGNLQLVSLILWVFIIEWKWIVRKYVWQNIQTSFVLVYFGVLIYLWKVKGRFDEA